jgi:hypothetical protein
LECLDVFGHVEDAVFKQPLDELRHLKAIYMAKALDSQSERTELSNLRELIPPRTYACAGRRDRREVFQTILYRVHLPAGIDIRAKVGRSRMFNLDISEELACTVVLILWQEEKGHVFGSEVEVTNNSPLSLPLEPIRNPRIVAGMIDERRQRPERIQGIHPAVRCRLDEPHDGLSLLAILIEIPERRSTLCHHDVLSKPDAVEAAALHKAIEFVEGDLAETYDAMQGE